MAYYQGQGQAHQQYYAPPPGPPPQHLAYQQHAQTPGPPAPQGYYNYQQPPAYQQHPAQQQQYQTQHQQSQPQPQPQPQQYQPQHQRYPSQNGAAAQAYRPRTGFTNLPTRFHVWNSNRGMNSYMNMGATHLGTLAYSSKMGGGSKTKIKAGTYQDSVPAVGEARNKGPFSSKNIISFQGHESVLNGAAGMYSGAKWPIDMPVRGRSEQWEWRRRKSNASMLKKLLSGGGFGEWDLCPVGAPAGAQGVATWTNGSGGSSAWSVNGAEMGIFQFHGQAAAGALGDQFMAIAIISIVRMINLYVIEKVASAVGSAAG